MHKGWYKIPGVQDGDRTLEQQLLGLRPALAQVRGQGVMDLGCAEALVGREFLRAGAADYLGVEIVAANVAEARRQLAEYPVATVVQANLDDYVDAHEAAAEAGTVRVDLVLALAILHKLKAPARCVRFIGRVATQRAVIRTAERTPGYVQDVRSGDQRFEIIKPLRKLGLHLAHVEQGPFNEWTGYFERRG